MSVGSSRHVRNVVFITLGVAAISLAGAFFFSSSGQEAAAPQDTMPYEAPVDLDTANLPGPTQPILYRHDVHAGQYEMQCQYCHYAVEVSQHPGLPSMSTCMGCHTLVGTQNPEVQKLREMYGEGQVVEWVKVHELPQFVQFPHMRHVNAEIECQECHGPIERMPQVYQYASLKMGWCLDCHYQEEVSTDCSTCHY